MKSDQSKNKSQDVYLFEFMEAILKIIGQIILSIVTYFIQFLVKNNYFNAKNRLKTLGFRAFLADERITVDDTHKKIKDFSSLEKMIQNPDKIPIGKDLKSNSDIYLTTREMNQHVLVAGATGEGKTTLMTSLIRHAIFHNRPVIIIDPKGDVNDLHKIKQIAKKHGRIKDFKVFSLSNLEDTCFYNPLKIGTPEQLKSKFIEALNLEHEYYGAVASQYLGNLFDIYSFVYPKEKLTLNDLLRYLTSPNDLGKLDNELKSKPRSQKVTDYLGKMQALKSAEKKDLYGLIAQINSMCLSEFDDLLGNSKNQNKEIDLYEALNNKEIIYFQLSTPSYADFSTRIGKLILQDLKLITNLIQIGKLEKKYDFGVVLVDEFGSFASKSFAELLKMIRSSGIGMNMFFQGIGDLKEVSPYFAEQVLGNTKIKIILRQEISTDVETWSKMAGTEDTQIKSYQISTNEVLGSQTGMGNMHEGQRMKLDFNIFKNLKIGQAIIINKGRHTQNLFQIWQQNENDFKDIEIKVLKKPNLFIENTIIKKS